MLKSKKIIAICSSAAFYKQDIEIMESLKKLGFQVKLPYTAMIMKRTGNYDVNHYKTWFKNNNYSKKAMLMRRHFDKIVNIGGNVLMEMGIAFHFKKPIFIYNQISKTSKFKEEILGMLPIFINQDLEKIEI